MAQDFTVDRNSSKWVIGSDGFLKEYANDEAAIEFNADGSYKGVLVEPAGTNEAKASEDLDNATYWELGRTTIATDTETDPKGGTNSYLLSETVDNGDHFIRIPQAQRHPVSSGETWTNSIFVKKGNGANAPDIVQLTHSTPFGASQYANFDISVGGGTSGTVTDSSGGTARIRYYGNGWYRISWTATSGGQTAANVLFSFTNNNPTAGRTPSYIGQANANIFIWGAQLEESPIATSYIPTTTSAVTRVKDDIYLTSASSLIGQTEGTLFIEVDWQDSGDSVQIFSISDDSADNRIAIINNNNVSPAELRMLVVSNTSTEVAQGEVSSAYTGIQKIALAYKQNDCELYRNGSSISTDTSADLSSLATLTDVNFGQAFNASAQANMWIRAVALFTTRLSDPECEALTTI